MFHAILIACLLGASPPEGCVRLDDPQGPYATEAECRERLREMRADLVPQLPPHRGRMQCRRVRAEGEAA